MSGDEPRLAAPQPADPVLLRELRATLQEIRDRFGPQCDIRVGTLNALGECLQLTIVMGRKPVEKGK